MKTIDENNIDQLPGIKLESDDTFCFRCYPGIACFNRCCRNLNLYLYPYDVIRLKKKLNISSDQFLDRHTDIILRDIDCFPEVLLRMSDHKERTCPFLTKAGCSVYPDRPDTCRTFPMEQGVFFHAETQKTELVHFYRPPGFCMGQHEKKRWTIQSWVKDQDAALYNKMTVRWSELKRLFQTDPWGGQGPKGPKAKMAFMATYNIDQFRDFLFKSTFLKRYKVKSVRLKKIKKDDVELMKFGFEWVKFTIWGIETKYFKLR
jgi:Fe-S-cluster containining protein